MVNALPTETKIQMIDAYVQGGTDGMRKVVTTGVLVDTAERCIEYGEGDFDQLMFRARAILLAFGLREGAAARLSSQYDVDGATLERAWASLTPEHRRRFGKLGKSDDLLVEATITFVHAARPDIPRSMLKRADSYPDTEFEPLVPVVTELTTYAMGRGILERSGS